MKKVISFVVCCIAVHAVTSCGNSSTERDKNAEIIAQELNVTGSDGTFTIVTRQLVVKEILMLLEITSVK